MSKGLSKPCQSCCAGYIKQEKVTVKIRKVEKLMSFLTREPKIKRITPKIVSMPLKICRTLYCYSITARLHSSVNV